MARFPFFFYVKLQGNESQLKRIYLQLTFEFSLEKLLLRKDNKEEIVLMNSTSRNVKKTTAVHCECDERGVAIDGVIYEKI